ncbi:jg5624 [Pararge aegeria aegeria]|uniref:Jg5624 protein n=1 Tax=Pararge aegeria aegeria TaxID=348720 RepID=A0A8S4QT08_9NEOP|nr:jg5624 [Pararge aegeria aegeria]
MEDTVRSLLQHKSRVETLKQEKVSLSSALEGSSELGHLATLKSIYRTARGQPIIFGLWLIAAPADRGINLRKYRHQTRLTRPKGIQGSPEFVIVEVLQ